MNKLIRVLHTEWSNGWGGQEIRILDESEAFILKGYAVFIAAQPNSELLKRATQKRIPTLGIKMNKGINIIPIIKFVIFIKKNHIDIVHTHSSVDSRTAGIAAKIARIKIIRSRHISVPISKSYVTWWQYMKLADRIIVSGRDIRNTMIRDNKMIADHIVSAPAGADIEQFSVNRNLSDIRPNYNLDDSHFLVGIVSVLRSWKGHQYLIKAIEGLVKSIPNIRLIIVGNGPQKKNIEKLIQELDMKDHVILTGHQVDPAPFYQAMDVMVLPSYAGEATSQVLPQAMLMGKPVISTNIGGLSEVVIHNQTGLIVPAKNSKKIEEAIWLLFSDCSLRIKLSEQGKEHALKNFTFDKMIKTTEQVYLDVLNS
jgi:glycosyltransferase involved in cell wall biosynthesis